MKHLCYFLPLYPEALGSSGLKIKKAHICDLAAEDDTWAFSSRNIQAYGLGLVSIPQRK